jgi:SAM-dependent methyltransferase
MKKCTVCAIGAPRSYGEQEWDIKGSKFRLAVCTSCGSIFTDPLPDDATLQNLYERDFDYRWYQDHYEAKLCDSRIRVNEYRNTMGSRVLDFGGGLGYFSAACEEQGFESRTFDPFYDRDSDIEPGWDTLVALHVLEHANNLDALVEKMKGLLKPGGNVILAVPNLRSRGYQELGMAWVWAQPPLLHIFHFTAAGLRALLARHGFRDLRISYHERWDANLYTDLEQVDRFRKLDAAWSRRPLAFLPLYRRKIARRNASERFHGLEQAMKGFDPARDVYAELQIIATAP